MHHRAQKSQNRQYKKIIIATLNVSSLVWKFDELKVIGHGIFDIFIINEKKLDASFSVNQFRINRFSTPYRFDQNRNWGGDNSLCVRRYYKENGNEI